MVATPTVVTEMGQSPLLVPKAKWQVMFGSTDPKFPSCPAPGSGLFCSAVGNWPQCVSPANHAQAITRGALVSTGYSWAGARAELDHVGNAGSTLGPVPCLLLLSTVDVGLVHKVMVQVNLPPLLPLVVVHLQEKGCKSPCTIQHEEETFSCW